MLEYTIYTELVGNMRKINLFIGMVLTTVLLAACGQHNKPEFKGDISGENDLEQTQSYFTNGMHEVTKCPNGILLHVRAGNGRG